MKFSAEKKKIAFFLMSIVTVGQLAIDLYLPSMPHIAESLQSSVEAIKFTIPIYVLTYGLSQLFYGPISDSIGRKPICNLGLLIFIIGSLGCLFAPNSSALIISRTIQGLGIGGSIISARSIMRDAYHGKQMAKVSAWIVMAWSVTPIVAPVIGGYIQSYLGWRAVFAVMLGSAALMFLLSQFLMPETLDPAHQKKFNLRKTFQENRNLFKDKVFIAFSLMSSFCFGYFLSYATASPFLLQTQLGLSPIAYGWTVLIIALGITLGSVICSRIVMKIKMTSVIMLGSMCMLSSTLAMFILAIAGIFNVYAILIPPFLGSIGGGMIFPNCTTGALTPYKSKAGIAGAMLGAIQMFNSFIFTWVISRMPSQTAIPLSSVMLIISILMFLIFRLIILPYFQEEEDVEATVQTCK